MQPFKVTFKFAAPVLRESDQPIHLDALIAYAFMMSADEMGREGWNDEVDLSAQLQRTEGDPWVWKASAIRFTPSSERQWVNQIRRSDPERYFADLGKYWAGSGKANDLGVNPQTFKINTRSGQQRGYQWLSPVQWMAFAEAWGVGDIDEITDLLNKHITHLGKKGCNGYGRISSIDVVPAPPGEDGYWQLRTLPPQEDGLPGVQYEAVQATLRAPYWNKLNRVAAKEPIL